ncbi:MAG: hypothetical protein NC307_09030 [Roseburia sp.]|nr:hypothetical protein [Roseburia sp.]
MNGDSPSTTYWDEMRMLWEHVEDIPYTDIILILIYTGWRIMELLTMTTANRRSDKETSGMIPGVFLTGILSLINH